MRTRLFRYPLSYMIYSAAFDNLPPQARELIYRRLFDVLSGKDQGKTFARLSAEDRAADAGDRAADEIESAWGTGRACNTRGRGLPCSQEFLSFLFASLF